MTQILPTGTHSALVGYCPVGEFYVEPYMRRETCPGCEERHFLSKRRVWICERCELRESFRTLAHLMLHMDEGHVTA